MYFVLWVTFPLLAEGIETIKRWGFQYRTLGFCWIKKNKKKPTWFFGLGFYTRQNPEICLLAVKGRPKRISKKVFCIIETPLEGHSKKPDIVREMIVELMGDVPRIELFARQTYEGWDCLGNEIDGKDVRESIQNYINKEENNKEGDSCNQYN